MSSNSQTRRNSPQHKLINSNKWTEWSECNINTQEKTRHRNSEEESVRCYLDNSGKK